LKGRKTGITHATQGGTRHPPIGPKRREETQKKEERGTHLGNLARKRETISGARDFNEKNYKAHKTKNGTLTPACHKSRNQEARKK